MTITAIGVLLSQSRGGLLVAVVGMSVTCVLFWRQKLIDSRAVLCLLTVSVVGIAAVVVFGQRLDRELSSNVDSIQSGQTLSLDREGSRQKIWDTDIKVVKDFPKVGTGLGTHRFVYPSYHDFLSDGAEYTHAENGYLQIAMETGVTGLAITLLLISLVGYWCVRGLLQATSIDIQAPFVVALSVLAINLTHSLTDFVWYVPGCMVIVVLAAASASVLYRLANPQPVRDTFSPSNLGRAGWAMMLVLVIAGLGWGVQVKWPEVAAEPHYHEFKRMVNSKEGNLDDQSSTTYQIATILRAAQANPHDPILQLRAGRAHMRAFLLQHAKEHDLRLEDIRQAALSSKYSDRQALTAWLENPEVMGENLRNLNRSQTAYMRAIRLCPLEPRPYIEISKLAWLSLAPQKLEQRLMDQALVAHPFEGSVWLEYAHFQTNSGRPSEAIASYQKAFQQDVRCRSAIIADLSPHYPSSYFLRTFPMDRGSLTVLRSTYKGTQDARGYRNVLLQLAKAELESATRSTGEESASHIVTAHGCYAEMGEDDLATSILQKAIKRHSNSYNLRSNLAHWLYNHEQYAESLPHLEWCCRRRPNDKVIRERVDIAELRSHSRIQVADDQSDERRTR